MGGDPTTVGKETNVAYRSIVSPSYFDTVGTRLERGRLFDENDNIRSRPVALINASMARQLFPKMNPIGQVVGAVNTNQRVEWMEIVGVVEDTRPIEAQSTGIAFHVYQPYAQRTWQFALISVRATTPEIAATLVGAIREKAAEEVDPTVALRRITPMVTLIEQQTRVWATINSLLVLFAGLGLLLAALGVYGVVSRTIAQRTGEFGIRMALGAQARDILRLVLGANLRTALLGAGVGVIGALVLARYPGERAAGVCGGQRAGAGRSDRNSAPRGAGRLPAARAASDANRSCGGAAQRMTRLGSISGRETSSLPPNIMADKWGN